MKMKNNLEENGLQQKLDFLSVKPSDFSWQFLEVAKSMNLDDYVNASEKIPEEKGIYVISTNKNFFTVNFCGVGLRKRIIKEFRLRKKIENLREFDYDLKIWYNEFTVDSIIGEYSYYESRISKNYHEQVLIEELKPFIQTNRETIFLLSPHEENRYREIILKKGDCKGFSIWCLKEMLISTSLIQRNAWVDKRYFNNYKMDEQKVNKSNMIIYSHLKDLGYYE